MVGRKAEPAATGGVQAVERALAILRLVAEHQRTGVAMPDLARLLGLPRPTVYRIAQCLEAHGFLLREPQERNLFLGDFFANLSGALGAHDRLRELALEPLRHLARLTGNTAYLIVRVGDEGRCIALHEGSFDVRIVTIDVGTQRPLGVGGAGLAILAALDEAERRAVMVRNARHYGLFANVNVEAVQRAVARARRRGYAVNDAQRDLGVKSIARVLRNVSGEPIAAISLSSVRQRIEGHEGELDDALRRAVEAVERSLAARRGAGRG